MKYVLIVFLLLSYCSANGPENVLKTLFPPEGPGYQYLAVNSKGELYSKTGGLKDIKGGEPMLLTHTMAALSMTKTVTAIGILKLVEDGQVSLEDPVVKYTAHPYDQRITVKDLILHTAGIPNPIPLKWVHMVDASETHDEDAVFNAILKKHDGQKKPPGEKYAYSNIGYWLLGRVVEKAAGVPFETYILTEILKPLNLEDKVGFTIPDRSMQAKGYVKKWSFMGILGPRMIDRALVGENEQGYIHIRDYYLNGPAFGGLIGSAESFSRILQDILSDDPIIIKATTRELMFSIQRDSNGDALPMVLGWHVGSFDNFQYYYKEGGGAGFRSEMRIYPEYGVGTVLMMNKTSFNFKMNMSKIDNFFLK